MVLTCSIFKLRIGIVYLEIVFTLLYDDLLGMQNHILYVIEFGFMMYVDMIETSINCKLREYIHLES